MDTAWTFGLTVCGGPTCRHQSHRHYAVWALTVMEEKWSDGWLLAAPSQMAAGTVLRLADSQRTSKLRRALKLISARSQEAKGTGQRRETAIDKDCGSQKSQQAWKGTALAFFFYLFLYSSHILVLHFSPFTESLVSLSLQGA